MKVSIITHPIKNDPEAIAMLQAMYSRSHTSMDDRLETLSGGTFDVDSIKAALNRYYVGYGHASIGDCGTVYLSVEGVSMLAAKAIQDDPLYNGQESSTRFIDFSQQGAYVPERLQAYAPSIAKVMKGVGKLADAIFNIAVAKAGASDTDTNTIRGLRAEAFDVARAFIPCGALTQLSWVCSMRAAQEGCVRLKNHPLEEVQEIGQQLHAKLMNAYPSAFYEKAESIWEQDVQKELAAQDGDMLCNLTVGGGRSVLLGSTGSTTYNLRLLATHAHGQFNMYTDAMREIAKRRPQGSALPNKFNILGSITAFIPIDFACYRDLQRHRSATMSFPIVYRGVIHKWYSEQIKSYLSAARTLSDSLYQDLLDAYNDVLDFYETMPVPCYVDMETVVDLQYLCPMGTVVYLHAVFPLSSAVYVAELRSKPSVHPILRGIAKELGTYTEHEFGIPVYVSDEATDAARRGKQTITTKD